MPTFRFNDGSFAVAREESFIRAAQAAAARGGPVRGERSAAAGADTTANRGSP